MSEGTSELLFEQLSTTNGRQLGVITLNVPATLNSLNLAMIDGLAAQLLAWRDDNSIVMVIIQSASDKAFCAGGDIQALYQSMVEKPGGPNPYCEAFFEREYRLDLLLATYPKPVLGWGHGIAMGGGLGILAACSHRVGTHSARIAFPEITIGLFPDAGATWWLNRMPRHWAYFIAWTGCHLNARDARMLGFLDYLMGVDARPAVHAALQEQPWNDDPTHNHDLLRRVLQDAERNEQTPMPDSVLMPLEPQVEALMSQVLASEDSVAAFVNASHDGFGIDGAADDPFVARAMKAIQQGSPTTARIIHEQLQRATSMSRVQMFQQELVIAVQCSRHPDFAEGVRALLIDKDNKPRWHFGQVEDVPQSWVDEHFTLPWAQHPMADPSA